MVRSVEHYPTETIVVVHGKLRKAPNRVKNATIHDYEIDVYEVHKVSDVTESVPFTVYDAENINRDNVDELEEEADDASHDDLESDSLSKLIPEPHTSTGLSGKTSLDLMSKSKTFPSLRFLH
jgi:hypothetical protein